MSDLAIEEGMSVAFAAAQESSDLDVNIPEAEMAEQIQAKTFRKKTSEELELYRKIVDDLDANALTEYYEPRKGKLINWARSKGLNKELAEDAVQTALFKIYREMQSRAQGKNTGWCKNSDHFDTWVYSIVRYESYHLRIAENKNGHEELDAIGAQFGDDAEPRNEFADPNPESEPLEWLVAAEREQQIDAVLERIHQLAKDDERVALVVQFAEGATYFDLADKYGMPIGTVRSRIFRGRKKLEEAGLVGLALG